MNSELVSIIIPAYNRAHYLVETLNSVQAQTYSNWECIVIDDGSNDDTESVLQEFLKDTRFKYLKRPDHLSKGANSCRNYGFEKSVGDFIQWFDSDDLMVATHLEDLVTAIKEYKVDFAVGESENFDDQNNEILDKTYIFDRSKQIITAEAFAKQQIGWITDDFLGTRSSIASLRFNPNIITDGDEYNFFSRYLIQSEKGVFVNKILTKRRIHNNALSSPTSYNKIQFLKKISNIKYQTFLDLKKSDRNDLKRWFLKGYMLNSFFLAQERIMPLYCLQSFIYISKYYTLPKAFAFIGSIISGLLFKKGYAFLEYSRR